MDAPQPFRDGPTDFWSLAPPRPLDHPLAPRSPRFGAPIFVSVVLVPVGLSFLGLGTCSGTGTNPHPIAGCLVAFVMAELCLGIPLLLITLARRRWIRRALREGQRLEGTVIANKVWRNAKGGNFRTIDVRVGQASPRAARLTVPSDPSLVNLRQDSADDATVPVVLAPNGRLLVCLGQQIYPAEDLKKTT